MTEPQRSEPREGRHAHWRDNLRVMAVLLCVWFVVAFGLGIALVEPLNRYRLGGFPLGFWFAQQGAIYVFVVLILVYALWMDRIDARHDQHERSDPQPDDEGRDG